MPGVTTRLWVDHSIPAARSIVATHARCDAQQAFDYVTDFSRHSEWTTGEQRIEKLTPGPTAVGTKLHSEGFQGGRWWPADLTVTRFERPSLFEFTATGGPIATPAERPHRHTYRFAPEGDGIQLTHEREDAFSNDAWYIHVLGPVVIRATGGVRARTTGNLRDRLEAIAREHGGEK